MDEKDGHLGQGAPSPVGDKDGLARRELLKLAAVGLAPFGVAAAFGVGETPNSQMDHGHASLITRQKEPENLESPFSSLQGTITPNELFYVRTHFATPHLSANDWRLTIEGAVDHPLTLTLEELKSMPSKTVTATLECAGNSRVYLTPPARGVLWEQGAVSTAEWTGVPLARVLERAGLQQEAVEIVLEGTDRGELKDPPHPGGALHFSRSLPRDKANQDNVLLAYSMNGEPLSASHGFPVRAIVPGWFAVASVKWLKRLVAVTEPYHGYFQTIDYAYWQEREGFAHRVPITSLLVKSQIARPTFRESIARGSRYRITGAAWAGESNIAKVDVSTDAGQTWKPARLLGAPVSGAWRLWDFEWTAPSAAGPVSLMSRATDEAGNVQPTTRDLNRENYMINQIVPIEVEIR